MKQAQVRAARVVAGFVWRVDSDLHDELRDRIAEAILRAFEQGEEEQRHEHGLCEGFER